MKLAIAILLCSAALAQTNTERLARWKPVAMPFHGEALSAKERQMVEKLVEAARLLDQLFWQQSDQEGYKLYKTTPDATLRSLLGIMGGRWDLTDENHTFAGQTPMPLGRDVYPHDLTKAAID